MVSKIIEYFKTDRTFSGGKALYRQCPGKNLAIERALNRKTDTPNNLEVLHYELWKLTGKNDRMRISLCSQSIQEKEVKVVKLEPTAEEVLIEKLKELPVTQESISVLKMLQEESTNPELIKLIEQKIVALSVPGPDDSKEDLLKNLEEAPVDVKKSIKLRDQFPFLKSDNYPEVYKILVADLITAREKFVAAHPLLFTRTTEEERLQATKNVVEPYIENKQILEELAFYQANGKPLGKHPIFEVLAQKEKLKTMTADELAKRRTNVEGYIKKAETALKEAKTDENEKKIKSAKDRIEKYTNEEAFITVLLKTEK